MNSEIDDFKLRNTINYLSFLTGRKEKTEELRFKAFKHMDTKVSVTLSITLRYLDYFYFYLLIVCILFNTSRRFQHHCILISFQDLTFEIIILNLIMVLLHTITLILLIHLYLIIFF